ncbi:3-phenylpropionate/trans-cinnamate dioxygenase ferredoxin reductase subunit [Nakamurella panacisegetis]|uniref:3-phenylpropionate/trans-cinnamate dioxygenase ferredoxin reductase subunit n=1 Tax=Nakamurella panacisegetis TaxID=1090615 RepID=A0A1H0SCV6_9ACTN|nr:3-phenylpropionate/trans-cinnamate dioxygenase ferredoxin reductase subunit [Nakamurella panacisegetis]
MAGDPTVHDGRTFVVVGAGLAGARAVEAWHERGFTGKVVLIGDEAEPPYERPPLSKGYLNGTDDRDSVFVHPAEWYADHGVDLRMWTRVTAIDPVGHQVDLQDGRSIHYDKLLLTTGSRPRPFPGLPDALPNVHYLRRLTDSDTLKGVLATAGSVVVVGAGWIGLEVAAAARTAHRPVTVIESAELPLLRVLGREAARVFADLHSEHGVDLRLGVAIDQFVVEDGRAKAVRLADGTVVEGHEFVVGIGVVPNVELAAAAGLDVDDGVVVDASLRTSDPDIFAAGDVARAAHPLLGRSIRVEHWANADRQPAVAAAAMLGDEVRYDRLPYFFTDQYDLGMEYTGYVEPDGYDEVVFRGDVGRREFIAFWLRDGRVLAGMNVNVWDVTDAISALIRSGRPVDSARLADVDVPLDTMG